MIAVASVDYRLTSQAGLYGAFPVTFPAQIEDVKGAIRFLRANAGTYGLDPTRFGAWGSSAGGHLAALVGTSGGVAALEGTTGGNLAFSSSVQAVCGWFGPIDVLQMNPDVTTPPGSGIDHDATTSPESRNSYRSRHDRPAARVSEPSNRGGGELTITSACAMPNSPTATGTSGMPLSRLSVPSV